MGHIGFGRYFDHFIHAFHMPMFFFVSGIFFKVRGKNCEYISIRTFILKKVKNLIVPYLIFGIFHYLMWLIFYWPDVSLEPLLHVLFTNTNDNMPIAGALWFLTGMFFSTVVYFLIQRYIGNGIFQNVVVVVVALFGCTATMLLPFRLPYALDAAFVGVGLIHIGWLFKKYESRLSRLFDLKWYEFLILGAVTAVLIFMNGYINMRQGSYAIIPLFWFNAVFATVVGINLAKYFVKFDFKALNSYLASVGKNSIVYLCLNQLVILVVMRVMRIVIPASILSNLAVLIISLIGLRLLENIFMGTRLRVVFGKN